MIRRLARLVRSVLSPGDGLTERTVKGGMWVAALNVSDRMLQLVLMIILANLLGAAELGLFGIALVVMSGVKRFSQLGLNQSLIYDREENVDHMLNTAWLLDIARTSFIALTLVVIAHPFAGLLVSGDAATAGRAAVLIQVIGLGQLFVGLANPGIVYFQKDLQFHKQFFYSMSGSVVQFGVAIGYAYLVSETAMALVLAFVASDFVRMLASYLLHDYRPSVSFDVPSARSMISYGKWLTANSILYFLYSEGDDLLVSGFLGPLALGYYQLAYRFSNAPATEVTHVISGVAFPAYSKVQDNTKALREGFHRTLQMTTFLSFPLAMGIFAITPAFVDAFLAPEYEAMVLTMQILAIFGLTRSAVATFGPVFKATGRPDLIAKFSTVRVLLLGLGLPVVLWQASNGGLPYGLTGYEGAALVILGVQLFPMMEIDVFYAARIVETSYTRILRDVAYPLVGSVGMAAAVIAADRMLDVAPVAEFVVLAALGAVVYAGAVLVLDRFGWGVGRNVRTMVASMAG
ncbi:lipopolysaccharide biosynthesis protein [Halomarina oriensis]|uniref:Oligosaccharide flippase family protein n=1 Tax=Halomarina oriensis TaxID=671145 RepID=A0A6B0GHF2_9EURY|nr:lipopolysaccharide biosynthesis protein [Halomarina oriensis]MWG33201.1 oligosaccharide flippase family protein [Halomarina oriensis]